MVAGLTISFKCNGDFYGWILKVAGHPQLREGRSSVWTPNPVLEGPGPSVTQFQGDFIK